MPTALTLAALTESSQRIDRDMLNSQVVEARGRIIIERAERHAHEKGVKTVRTVVADGDPQSEILKCAEEAKSDMIVLGSRGRGDLAGLLMGSVSHKVSHRAGCTCITVE